MNDLHLGQAAPCHNCTVVIQNRTVHLDLSLGNNHSDLGVFPDNCKRSDMNSLPLYKKNSLEDMNNLSFDDDSSSKEQ